MLAGDRDPFVASRASSPLASTGKPYGERVPRPLPTGPVRTATASARVRKLTAPGLSSLRPDLLATEEPLEIRAHGPGQEPATVAVTMRTPGHDFELAVGHLLVAGVVTGPDDVRSVRYCVGEEQAQQYNVVSVSLAEPLDEARLTHRHSPVTASCGICGADSLDALAIRADPMTLTSAPLRVSPSVVLGLPDALREHQRIFSATGGLHGVGLFSADGAMLAIREDVGRHNAVDALLGWALLGRRSLASDVLVLSGRVSYEIVQKAAIGGIPVVVAVSAPTSLAVSAAERFGITLVAFTRDGAANVYAHPSRIAET